MSASVIVNPNQGERLNVVGDHIRVLLDSSMTNGLFSMMEAVTEPGCGPPLHRHNRDDEAWFVIEGTMKFVINGEESTVTAGSAVFAPRGSVHTFMNVGTKPCRSIIICTPGGLEAPLREADALAKRNQINPEALAAAFRKIDLDFLGPPLCVGAAAPV